MYWITVGKSLIVNKNAIKTIEIVYDLANESDNVKQRTPVTMKIEEKCVILSSVVKMSLIGRDDSVDTMINSPSVNDPGANFIKHDKTNSPNTTEIIKIIIFSFPNENKNVTNNVTIILKRKSIEGMRLGDKINKSEMVKSRATAEWVKGEPIDANAAGTENVPQIIPFPAPCRKWGRTS